MISMTRSTITALILLCMGIALGGGGMYLLYVTIVSNKADEIAYTSVELETSGLTSSSDYPLTYETHLPSFSDDLPVKSLEDPTLHHNAFEHSLAIYSYVSGLSEDQITRELYATTSEELEQSHCVRTELQLALLEKLALENPVATAELLVELQDTRNDLAFMSMIQEVFKD